MRTAKMLKWLMPLLIFGLAPALAQTGGEMRQKYGNPDDKGRYMVRPGVMLSMQTSPSGEISDIRIEPQSVPQPNDPAEKGIPQKVLTGLIDEFAPPSRRGHYIRSITFNGGCTSIKGVEYAKVTIQQTSLCKASGGEVLSSAVIHWKQQRKR